MIISRRKLLRSALAAPAIIKATSLGEALALSLPPVTSTVSVSSLGFGYPGGVPAIAGANGLNTLVFFDDFNFTFPGSGTVPGNSTIDINNTGSPGYNWYVNPNTPEAKVDNCGWLLNGWPSTPANEIVVGNSVLTLGLANSSWNNIQTIYTASGGVGNYVGQAFSAAQSFLLEVRMQFSSAGPGTGAGSALGLYNLELYIGQATQWLEIDFYEASYDLYDGFHYHDFAPGVCTDLVVNQGAPSQDSNWHTYDILYLYNSPTSGTITRYYDGSWWNSFTWTSSYYSQYAIFSTQHWFFLMRGGFGGVNSPMAVDWVGLWQAS
jgi:hypothetical protein